VNIFFVTSEIYPLIKTGGLADVSNNLPMALQALNHSVRVLVPAYGSVLESIDDSEVLAEFRIDEHSVRIIETHLPP